MRPTRAARPLTRAALLTGLALAATPLVGLAPAYACSCLAAPRDEAYAEAAAVFKGTITKRVHAAVPAGQQPKTVTYVFKVLQAYKGKPRNPQRVFTTGGQCRLALAGDGPFLVFAHRADPSRGLPKGTLEAYLCGGTRPIGRHETPSFARPAPAPHPKAVAPKKPHPKPADKPEEEEKPLDLVGETGNPLGPVGPIATEGQHLVNRLLGPLLEAPRG